MADSVRAFLEADVGTSSEVYTIGSQYDPGSVTLTSSYFRHIPVTVPTSTDTALISGIGSVLVWVFIPPVAGIFTWTGTTSSAKSSIKARANMPFFLYKTSQYDADPRSRASATEERINTVTFYHTSGSDVVVDCFHAI